MATNSAQTTNAYSKNMKLSILTPTIPGREEKLRALQDWIQLQIHEAGAIGKVEHLSLCDNRARSIGGKRQALVDIAMGEYIAFVDDDDDIMEGYVAEILKAAESGADVITFHEKAIYNGKESEVHFGINNQDQPFKPGGITLRAPWHVCAWKKSAIKDCVFGENKYIEDIIWCRQARKRAKTGFHIPKVLHVYQHDAATTASPEPVT